MTEAASIVAILSAHLGNRWTAQPLNASTFCGTWRAQAAHEQLFVKSAPLAAADVLSAEADGLQALAATQTIRVPAVAGYWSDDDQDLVVLALEWLNFRTPTIGFGARFGQALAALHRALPPQADGRYGWRRNNTLGGTPQGNVWSSKDGCPGWIEFFGHQRLGAMRERLATGDAPAALLEAVDAVITTLPGFFTDGYQPRASLIHGDLWCGNWGMLADGAPVIYDPAVSCSDAEAELAMMELFGSPPADFWPAYRKSFRLANGYEHRRGLYQLYHLLNHALLFGGGYVQQSLAAARKLARCKGEAYD